jgi:UrcA family protein
MTTSLRATLRCALVFAAALAAAQSASAHTIDDSADQAPRVEINLAGVDLTTPEGQSTARHRISAAAWNVCRDTVDTDGTGMRRAACVLTARREGGRQLDGFVEQAMARAGVRAAPACRARIWPLSPGGACGKSVRVASSRGASTFHDAACIRTGAGRDPARGAGRGAHRIDKGPCPI